jgi:hypothetical protein
MKQPEIEELPGYDEMFQKLVEAMPVEKRLKGLAPEQLIPALPLEVLRALNDDYLRTLPPDVQEQIREKLRRAGTS